MNTYLSTFIPGFGPLIEQTLPTLLPDLTIDLLLDGLVVYTSSAEEDAIKDLRLFNNSFLLIQQFQKPDHDPIERMLYLTLQSRDLEQKILKQTQGKTKGFRIVISKQNQNIRIKNDLLQRLEDRIKNIKGLTINKSKASLGIWFLSRDEGYGFAAVRLTRPTDEDKRIEAGELKPELAHLLILASEPKKSDIILDPFCGHGAISLERVQYFPYKQMLTGDIDPQTIDKFRLRLKRVDKKIITGRWDATNLKTFQDNSINKIISDPPWGFYSGKHLNLPNFYTSMLQEAARILAPEGIAIYLVGQKQVFDAALKKVKNLKCMVKYDILVSGKKAAVYKIQKV